MDFRLRQYRQNASKLVPSREEGRGRHPANPFILFFLQMRKRFGGNCFDMAKKCGQHWKTMPEGVKRYYQECYQTKRLGYGSKAAGGYNLPSRRHKWNAFPKAQRRTAYVSKKEKAELAKQAAAVDDKMQKEDPHNT